MLPLPAPVVDAMLWREYRPAKQRLKIGILVDDWRVPDWMFHAIKLVASEPALELVALLKHSEALPPRAKRSALFNRLHGASRKKVDPEHPFHDLAREFGYTPRFHLSEGPSIDVLMRFDAASLKGPSTGLARMGVWSVGLGDSPEVPYWAEVRDQNPVSVLTLRHHPKLLEEACGFYSYAAPTLQGWFFTRNAVEPLRMAGLLLVDRLLEVAANGYDSVVCRSDSEIQSADDQPNLACLGTVARQAVRSITGRVRARGRSLRWVTALRCANEFREVTAPAGHGYADPFLVEWDGRDYLLLEDVPPGGRGRLVAMEIASDGATGPPEVILEKPHHVSYPFVFRHGTDLFLIPESAENKTVQLYRAGARAPFEWRFERNLFEGAMLVDTTVFHCEGLWYFFTTQVDYGMRGYLFYADSLDGVWQYHPRNPICSDVSRCRGAGALFYKDGRLIRPAQDCSVRYGYAIVLNEVMKLSPTEYEETVIERREPSWWGGRESRHPYSECQRAVGSYGWAQADAMKSVLVKSSPEDGPRIAQFLCKVFHASPDDVVARAEHMQWKYWAEREDWPGSRSFRLERDGVIVAHGAPWPSLVHVPGGPTLRGAQVIDWAAEPSVPGAGLSLMKNIAPEYVDLIFALGGSEATRKILPVFGFKPFNELFFFAKPLRPFAQILSHQHRNWKSPARLVRNLGWSLRSARPAAGWTSRAVEASEIRAWPETGGGVTVLGRDAGRFRYFAKCDLIRAQLYVVERDGIEAGYFYLVFVPGQARVADAWSTEGDVDSWTQIYAFAIERALEDPGTNEITTIMGLESGRAALERCGFRHRNTERLMIYDPRKVLDPGARLHFQMVDNDAFFRHSGRAEYET